MRSGITPELTGRRESTQLTSQEGIIKEMLSPLRLNELLDAPSLSAAFD
jgi:hypothetical protein